jgi:hypothetical protein
MYAESGGRANAIGYNTNKTFDSGCWQVNSIHAWRVGGNLPTLLDPQTNAQTALAIYNARGNWCPWSTAPKLGLCNK